MEYTPFPNIEAKVSRIGLGTWSIGGWMWGGTSESDALYTLHHALDLGINLIDTAPVYGFGHSEELVGKALASYGKRDQVILATKVGLNWENGKVFRDARKQRLQKELEDSLRRLQVDYIDLYQLHWPDPSTPIEETATCLNQFLKEGKIRAIGVSNLSTQQMEEFQKYAPLHTLQPPFNLFERGVETTELAYCLEKGIATLAYGSLCRGLLSGKIDKKTTYEGDDLRKVDPKFQEPTFSNYLTCVQKLQEWVETTHQKPLIALAVRWILDKGVNCALWGARHPSQLEILSSVWGWKLSDADRQAIDAILQESIPKPIGPEFMAPPFTKPSVV